MAANGRRRGRRARQATPASQAKAMQAGGEAGAGQIRSQAKRSRQALRRATQRQVTP